MCSTGDLKDFRKGVFNLTFLKFEGSFLLWVLILALYFSFAKIAKNIVTRNRCLTAKLITLRVR